MMARTSVIGITGIRGATCITGPGAAPSMARFHPHAAGRPQFVACHRSLATVAGYNHAAVSDMRALHIARALPLHQRILKEEPACLTFTRAA